nr:malonyl-CoA decarboxylase family protein [uncultured Ruegeria sp.]
MRALAPNCLMNAKGKGSMPFDPIAQFHLGNSALAHSLHANADTAQCVGTMVNYLYDLTRVALNHEQFANTHEMAASTETKLSAASTSLSMLQER